MSDTGKHSRPDAEPEITKQAGDFVDDLGDLLNLHSIGNHVGVPNPILAQHIVNHLDCLKETNEAVKSWLNDEQD